MSILLTLLTIYFGMVLLWAAPRLYRLLRTQWHDAMLRRTDTMHRAMPARYKVTGD